VPVERQWERSRTPLRRRDKITLTALAAVTAVAVGAGIAIAVTRNDETSSKRCVDVTVPSTMGGARIRRCGAAAVTFCRTDAVGNSQDTRACREAGFAVPNRRAGS
jgi:hypothetical protein